MVVWNRPDFLIGKNPAELATPGAGKPRVGAAARTKEESSVAQVFFQIFEFSRTENKIIVSIHEQKRRFVQVRIGQPYLAFFLDLERRGAGHQFHQVLAYSGAVVAVIG